MSKINKILVANRGEIALRIIRSAREMNIKTIAVFSEADRNSLHVRQADEAYFLGPSPSSQSYLKAEKILEACISLGADAVHPGYGFLSENAEFAEVAEKAGIIFIGPSANAIRTMGSKLEAKAAVSKYNIPMVPGGNKSISGIAEARQMAAEIGFPLLIKASAGGGGKGMRLVQEEAELDSQMERAVSEAISSFGDGAVFIEKYITSPRHIEVQIIGDKHGNTVHLFERECSIQRRYQKVIEEAPSAILTPEIRSAMGKAAVDVAKACNYYGAGTVEFVMDDKLNFYFLEMNTRLQVEHPVTEMITGTDLVKEQIRIAEGEKLSFRQEDLKITGHAIELRVYAEDPDNNFLPDTGILETYKTPAGPGIRVDGGFEQGMEIPVYYDPMIAKLAVWGKDRAEAIARMKRAISEFQISGIETTLPFGKFVMDHPAFYSGNFDTHFVQKYFSPEKIKSESKNENSFIAMALSGYIHEQPIPVNTARPKSSSRWKNNRK